MSPDTEPVIVVLIRLIETCKDGVNGYQTAARCVTNPDLKALFRSYAQQRDRYAAELQNEVLRLAGTLEKRPSLSGSLWRAWTNIKSLLNGGSDHAVMAECERGEDAARGAYQEALTHPLPPHVHALIERQFAGIKEAHDRVHSLDAVVSGE